jgi:hypothetical protein
MIRIQKTPYKKTEFFKGTITLVFPFVDNTEWNFTLMRSVNGETKDEAEADMKQIEKEMEYDLLDTDELRQRANERIAQIIITVEETVLANLKKEQVNFV